MEKPKVLVIDDEPEFCGLLKDHFSLHGFEVNTASDGEEGLRKARANKPDVVICDIMMPKKDGYEVLKEIRKTGGAPIPVIMVSVIDEFGKVKEAYDGQADFYVSKPVELESLMKSVRTLLGLQRLKKQES